MNPYSKSLSQRKAQVEMSSPGNPSKDLRKRWIYSDTDCFREYKVSHLSHKASINLSSKFKDVMRNENYEKERKVVGGNMIISVDAEKHVIKFNILLL